MCLSGLSSSKDTVHMWPWLIRVSQKMNVFLWVHYLFLHSLEVSHVSKGVEVHLPMKSPQVYLQLPGVDCTLGLTAHLLSLPAASPEKPLS